MARVFDFGLESGKVYTGVVSAYLGVEKEDDPGAVATPLWRIRHTDGDEEDLDKYELASAYHKLEEHQIRQSRGRKRRREMTGREAETESTSRRRRSSRMRSDTVGDVSPPPPGPVTYDHVLHALSGIDFPVQSSRTNVTRGTPPRGFVLGAVNIRSHGGMQLAQATRDKPNLGRLLSAFFRDQCGDALFRYTTIQINANYEAALHVDKFNLGPSYIVGVGDWRSPTTSEASDELTEPYRQSRHPLEPKLAGRLWVQGHGALDCREKWVAFDGNTPHCTLPFEGTRFTLIYFTHCSQSILRNEDRALLSEFGFAMPHKNIMKAPHMRTAEERLEAGRAAYKAFVDEQCAQVELPSSDDIDDKERALDGSVSPNASIGADATPTKTGADATPTKTGADSTPTKAISFTPTKATSFTLDGAGGRPSSRVAQLSSCGSVTGAAPELRRHYGRALRRAAETAEALEQSGQAVSPAAVTPTFVSGENAGRAAPTDDSCVSAAFEKLAHNALVDRPKFLPYIENWEASAASRKDERGGARLLAKYAGLRIVDDDPYDLNNNENEQTKRTTSDAVVEAERERARLAKEQGEPLVEHRFVSGVEWCRFARRWTAVTQLAHKATVVDDTVEKYPIDKALIAMIVKAADCNDHLDFFDAKECVAKFKTAGRRIASRPRAAFGARPTDSDILPGPAVSAMIEDNIAIVVNAINPKKGRSADRYELYKHATTTREFLKLGGSKADLQNDLIRGHVSLAGSADWRELETVVTFRRLREEQRKQMLELEAKLAPPEPPGAADEQKPILVDVEAD